MVQYTYRGYILEQEQRVAEKKMDPMMLLMYHPHNELLKGPAMDQNPGWDR